MFSHLPRRSSSARRALPRILATGLTLALCAALLPTAAQAAGGGAGGEAPGLTSSGATTPAPAVAAPKTNVEQTAVPAVDPQPEPDSPSKVVAELPQTDTTDYRMVGVTWSPDSDATDVKVRIRTRDAGAWSDWTTLEVEGHESGDANEVGRPGSEPLWVGRADGVATQVTSQSGTVKDVKIATIDPGDDDEAASASAAAPASFSGAAARPAQTFDGVADATATADGTPTFASRPTIISRSSWGASGQSGCSSPTVGSTTRGVVIHHTAGSNSYSASQSKAVVRGVQAYHMKGNGWCDIGYNFLVDKYGQIFEGRAGGTDRSVRAAHSGNAAVNTYDMGVSLMGNLDDVKPSSAMKDSVVKLVGWRMGTFYLNAKGTYSLGGLTLNMIAGHRNVVSTGCPGKYGYAWLSESGGLRDRVESYLSKMNTDIEKRVKSLGTSTTGLVYTGESGLAGGHKTRLAKMDLYSKSGAGTRYVASSGGFRDRYNVTGGPAASLGYPTSDSPKTGSSVTAQRFQKGSIYAVPSRGTYAVTGPADALYRDLEGPVGKLGEPRSSSSATKTTFEDGYITVSGATATAYTSGGTKIASGGTTPPSTSLGTVGTVTSSSTSSTATFSWPTVSGATAYEVCLMFDYSSTSCARTTKPTATTLTFADLKPTSDTDYVAKVRAVAGSSVGEWSKPKGVNLATAASTQAPGTVGALTATSTSSSATFSWAKVSGATAYEVCLMFDYSSTSCARTTTITATKIMFSSLKPTSDTDYVGKVRAIAGSTVGEWSKPKGVNLATASSSTSTVTVPSSRTVSISGHGYGHGIGMSQNGAQGAALKGLSHSQILSHYYPGTSLGKKSGNIRVLISAATSSSTQILGQSGLKFYDISAKKTLTLPTSVGGKTVTRWQMTPFSSGSSTSKLQYRTTGGYVSYTVGGSLVSFKGDGQIYGSSAIGMLLPNGSTMKMRGFVRSAKPSSGSGSRDTVNSLSMDDYVRGVIAAEMPASWKSEALQAQAVAARTYGARSMGTSRYYDICSTTACQVYGGATRETSTTDAAVKATAGQILTYQGAPALAQFSASSGGYSAAGSQPYLKAVSDPYDDWSGNPNHSWKISVKASTIEKSHTSIGTLKKMTITKRNGKGAYGGRVTSVTLYGSSKSVTISGDDARWDFGLKSNWFTF